MSRVSIIVILGSALLSARGWAQAAGTSTASTRGSSKVSTEQTALTHPADNAQRLAQPGTAPQPIPGAVQNGTSQTSTNQSPTSANEDSDLARIPTDTSPARATDAKAPSTGGANERIYLENALTQTGQRGTDCAFAPVERFITMAGASVR